MKRLLYSKRFMIPRAWGELALASDEPEMALGIADRLLASVPGVARVQPIPWLLKLKGEALGASGRREEAIQALEEALQGALARQEKPLLWQLYRALGRQYQYLKQGDLAQRNFALARQSIASLADTIDDAYLHEHFLHAALSTLPKEKPVSVSRVAKEAFGGLMERERGVATLIGQGKSNREIADGLVVSYRTVETHVGTISWAEVIVGVDPDPANKDLIVDWARKYWEAVHPYSAGGAYVNFMMEEEGDARIKASYRDNYERLAVVKSKYDPTNFFRVNQNIKPA